MRTLFEDAESMYENSPDRLAHREEYPEQQPSPRNKMPKPLKKPAKVEAPETSAAEDLAEKVSLQD